MRTATRKQVDFIWKSVQNAGKRHVYHWNRSSRSLVIKSGQEITKGTLLTSEIFGNLRKYEARFTDNDVTSGKFQFPNIRN